MSRNFNKGILKVYALILLFLVGKFFLQQYSAFYLNFFQPLFLTLTVVVAYIFNRGIRERYKYKKDIRENVIIIMLIYFIIYCLSGLVFGFVRSPYDHTIWGIIRNFYNIGLIVILVEYIRSIVVKYSGNKGRYFALTVFLFTLVEFDFSLGVFNFNSGEEFFRFLATVIVPLVTNSFIATHLVKIAGFKSALSFRMPLVLMILLLPIYPDLNWFLVAVYQLLLVAIIYLITTNFMDKKIKRIRNLNRQERKLLNTVVSIIMISLLAFFIAGFFRYRPLAVMSNSMQPAFGRGDMLIGQRVIDVEELQLYDIISYRLDGNIIIHRIVGIDIDQNKKRVFITKGDNNEGVDLEEISEEQIIERILFRIPLAGFPTVWVAELFRS